MYVRLPRANSLWFVPAESQAVKARNSTETPNEALR